MEDGASVAGLLLAWYDVHRRSLPWRENRDPYRIWVSEVMLQQTRVETVLSYFNSFLERFPDIRTLAVQYRKGIHHPACVARLTLDGTKTLILDGNFQEDWGDCLYLDDVLHDTVPGHHTLDIEVTEDADGKALPFYLMSLIVS
jgi:hypothetical protein